jgi:hypothetical protein
VLEILNNTDTAQVKSNLVPQTFEDVDIFNFIQLGIGSSASDTTQVSESTALTLKPGPIIEETLAAQEALQVKGNYKLTYAEALELRELLLRAYPTQLTDSVAVAELMKAVRSSLILEGLRISDPLVPAAIYRPVFAEALRLSDSLRNFFGEDASDSVTLTESVARTFYPTKSVSDSMTLADVLGQSLIFRLTAAEELDISDTEVLKMIFKPALAEGFEISAAYVAPNGSITTWVVNTENAAVTEYSNYAFNSFAQMGYKYLGASSSGLYELNGDTDSGTDIISVIKTGLSQIGGSRFTMFKAAYLGVRGGGDYVLRLETGDGRYYDYNVIAQDMQTTKIRLGKGLRARYFSFQLTSAGQDFDLDSVEFVPIMAQRRV